MPAGECIARSHSFEDLTANKCLRVLRHSRGSWPRKYALPFRVEGSREHQAGATACSRRDDHDVPGDETFCGDGKPRGRRSGSRSSVYGGRLCRKRESGGVDGMFQTDGYVDPNLNRRVTCR